MNESSTWRSRARRQTGRAPRTFDDSVASPCVKVCSLDDAAVCVGCFRSADEIRDWMILDRPGKLAVLERAAARRAAAGHGHR